jgi:hypothetical protein
LEEHTASIFRSEGGRNWIVYIGIEEGPCKVGRGQVDSLPATIQNPRIPGVGEKRRKKVAL